MSANDIETDRVQKPKSGGFMERFQRIDERTPASFKLTTIGSGIITIALFIWWAAGIEAELKTRIAVLETKSETTARDLGEIKSSIHDLGEKIDRLLEKAANK